jgi:hypothetical protein
MSIIVRHRGNWNKTRHFLTKVSRIKFKDILAKYGEQGVRALREATPVDSGLTQSSWGYEILEKSGAAKNSVALVWTNANVVNGVPIAILIQYGHATRGGAFVQGRDYINPALRPIFDRISEEAWQEVIRA